MDNINILDEWLFKKEKESADKGGIMSGYSDCFPDKIMEDFFRYLDIVSHGKSSEYLNALVINNWEKGKLYALNITREKIKEIRDVGD